MGISKTMIASLAKRAERAASLMRGPDERVSVYFEGQYLAIEGCALNDLGIPRLVWTQALEKARTAMKKRGA